MAQVNESAGYGVAPGSTTAHPQQMVALLNAIAELACAVERTGEQLVASEVSDLDFNLIVNNGVIVKALARQMGWLADHGALLCSGGCIGAPYVGGAPDWMLPDAAHHSQVVELPLAAVGAAR